MLYVPPKPRWDRESARAWWVGCLWRWIALIVLNIGIICLDFVLIIFLHGGWFQILAIGAHVGMLLFCAGKAYDAVIIIQKLT